MLKRILLVDDTRTMRTLLRSIIGAAAECVEAESGAQAVQLAQSIRPDLILLDINMPDQSGVDTLRALKGCADTRSIPTIMLSAHNDSASVDACRSLGCTDFMAKPVTVVSVRAALQHHLGLKFS